MTKSTKELKDVFKNTRKIPYELLIAAQAKLLDPKIQIRLDMII
jgi:hypothetical protein